MPGETVGYNEEGTSTLKEDKNGTNIVGLMYSITSSIAPSATFTSMFGVCQHVVVGHFVKTRKLNMYPVTLLPEAVTL